jgi:hypothetical protein
MSFYEQAGRKMQKPPGEGAGIGMYPSESRGFVPSPNDLLVTTG